MTPLRPAQWLLHAHLVILPMIAAMVLEERAAGHSARWFDPANAVLLVGHHWFWLVVTLGLGVWVGWHTAIDRPHYQPPEGP